MQTEIQQKWYYKFAYFFIANQVVLKRLLVILLILLNIALWWPGGVKLVNYWNDSPRYKKDISQLTANLINWQDYHLKNRPKNLEILKINKIKTKKNKYDFVAKVFNPNSQWYLKKINYAFVVDGYPLDWQTDFVLPNQNKYLFHFSYFSKTPLQDVNLKIDKLNWQKITDLDKIKLLDKIIIQNKKFSRKNNQLDFKVANDTLYSFWQTGWQIVLYQNERPIAVNYVTSNKFFSGDLKNISVGWSETIGSISKIEIIPDINIFDNSNYITNLNIPPVNLIKGARDKK